MFGLPVPVAPGPVAPAPVVPGGAGGPSGGLWGPCPLCLRLGSSLPLGAGPVSPCAGSLRAAGLRRGRLRFPGPWFRSLRQRRRSLPSLPAAPVRPPAPPSLAGLPRLQPPRLRLFLDSAPAAGTARGRTARGGTARERPGKLPVVELRSAGSALAEPRPAGPRQPGPAAPAASRLPPSPRPGSRNRPPERLGSGAGGAGIGAGASASSSSHGGLPLTAGRPPKPGIGRPVAVQGRRQGAAAHRPPSGSRVRRWRIRCPPGPAWMTPAGPIPVRGRPARNSPARCPPARCSPGRGPSSRPGGPP